MIQLIPGNTYYWLTYCDKDCRFPSIASYIYTGKNLHVTDQGSDTWYFQDPVTYMLYGPLSEYPNEFNSGVRRVDARFLKVVHDLPGLIDRLSGMRDANPEMGGLEIGKLFFFLEYHDLELTLPIFNAFIYIGEVEDPGSDGPGQKLYLFRDASTYTDDLRSQAPDIADADTLADEASLGRFLDIAALVKRLSKLRERAGD